MKTMHRRRDDGDDYGMSGWQTLIVIAVCVAIMVIDLIALPS